MIEKIKGISSNRNKLLDGKVALITGGSSGIGLETAKLFAIQGARIVIIARKKERLFSAREAIDNVSKNGNTLSIVGDVTEENLVRKAFDEALSQFGKVDIVVSNAGHIRYAPFTETTIELWQDMIDVHATGYFLVAREAVRSFNNQKITGAIVFIISDNAIKPSKDLIAYNVAKAAELHLARCIADECGDKGIRINSILPGAVFGSSAFWTEDYREARARIHGFDVTQLEEEYKKNSALHVVIDPSEVAEAALFLASDLSSKITGAVISIDGGGKSGYVR